MKKILTVISVLIILIICSRWFFYETNVSKDNKLTIANKPDSVVYKFGKLDSLQIYKEGSTKNWERDLRCRDISDMDLRNNLNELLHSDFDSKTIWPKSIPVGFNPDKIMEIGRNPGLNIRKLHKEGITGKGIGIAIIDQNLLVDHCEYKDQLRMYEEIHIQKSDHSAQMHGPAVASIAVGKTVGVAPEADLYYISSWDGSLFSWIKYKLFNTRDINRKWAVKSIYRLLEINRTLPLDKKIRIISLSFGSNRRNFLKAIETAGKEGVFVISTSLSTTHNLRFG
ncbi:MAG: S8 family serine peptidase [Bacteroidia bacterium]|nr:S8 family serine peptidase [Bacteroidia bacterium]